MDHGRIEQRQRRMLGTYEHADLGAALDNRLSTSVAEPIDDLEEAAARLVADLALA